MPFLVCPSGDGMLVERGRIECACHFEISIDPQQSAGLNVPGWIV
jgi:hypothetical protein